MLIKTSALKALCLQNNNSDGQEKLRYIKLNKCKILSEGGSFTAGNPQNNNGWTNCEKIIVNLFLYTVR